MDMNEQERGRLLREVGASSRNRRELELHERVLIGKACALGATWEQVAAHLGVRSARDARDHYNRLDPGVEPATGIDAAEAEFDRRVADAIGRLSLWADQAGYVQVTRR